MASKNNAPVCGLCGKKKKLVKTDCCNNWICDDEDKYAMFSYARNSCSRNHRRFTLCGYHETEDHSGKWQSCKKCFDSFKHELEMYVWYGTNQYNFIKLENPPKFELTYCAKCGNVIALPDGGYTMLCGIYRCENCPITEEERLNIISKYQDRQESKQLN